MNVSDIYSPKHYCGDGVETIDKIERYLVSVEILGAAKFNIIKYVDRAKFKNGVEDLHKAMWYVDYILPRLIRDDTPFDFPTENIKYSNLKYRIFDYLKLNNFITVKIILQYMIDNYDSLL